VSISGVTAFGEDALGELYLTTLNGGLYKIESTDPRPDTDGDGIPDLGDNCPADSNPSQENTDGDSEGDICDPDDDNDGLPDSEDNCPLTPNVGQADADEDGAGDACDDCPDTLPGVGVDERGCPSPIPGDLDRDGDVDLTDFGLLQLCFSGPGVSPGAECDSSLLDGDNDVDQGDLVIFLGCLSGPNVPADPDCAANP
jgi:hypothetical protein